MVFRRSGSPLACTALLTPFRAGEVHRPTLEAAIDRQIAAGIDGIFVVTAIGEKPTLAQDERDEVIAACVARGRAHLQIVASTGTNSTRTTVEHSLRAQALGADAVLVTIPYYSKPSVKGIVEHFRQVTQAIRLPVVVEDDPGRTGIDHGERLLMALSHMPQIVGVCHGAERLNHFIALSPAVRQRFVHLSMDDRRLTAFLRLGGHGAVSPLANVLPHKMRDLLSGADPQWQNPAAEAFAEAAAAIGRDDVAALKEAAAFVHRFPGDVRLPLVRPEAETVVLLRRAFASFKTHDSPERRAG